MSRRDVEKSLFSDKHRLGVNAPVYASLRLVVRCFPNSRLNERPINATPSDSATVVNVGC